MSAANPFEVLYMGETTAPSTFVGIFSPLLVHETLALFRGGNSVLMGTQGSGKSMLLSLLKPETRLSFWQAEVEFPVPAELPFIGAGINFTRSGSVDFNQRAPRGAEKGEWETYFGDFVNYHVVRDVLASLTLLQTLPRGLGPVVADVGALDEFAKLLAAHPVWLGGLDGSRDTASVTVALDTRLRAYRSYLNFNGDDLPDYIRRAKTEAGEPISVAAELMRAVGLVHDSTNLLIRIDQYEALVSSSDAQNTFDFPSVIHRMMSSRDPLLSYKLGTRRYAWPSGPRVHGSSGRLEALRNYRLIDLDSILRSAEHDSGQFPSFAEDVFRRRMEWAGYRLSAGRNISALKQVFGESDSPHIAAARLSGVAYQPNAIQQYDNATSLRSLVELLWKSDPLSAQLGEAWLLQKGDAPRNPGEFEPWSSRRRPWWYKERVPLALTQLSASRRQRLVYSGKKDIVQLSGANILAFVSICSSIWDSWLGELERENKDQPVRRMPVSRYAQDAGIRQASTHWFEKITSDPDGHKRQRFVRYVGTMVRDWLRSDKRMSNPGFNGFSLDLDELQQDPVIREFLEAASAYGVLVDREHTSKNRPGGPRVAWYLNAVYAPYFQIPVARQKEPRYVRTADVRQWMEASRALPRGLSVSQEALF